MAETLFTSEITSNRTHRLKKTLGRTVVKASAIISCAASLFGGITATEAAAGKEAIATASSYGMNGAEKAWCRWPSRWNLCNQAGAMSNVARTEAGKVAAEKGWSLDDGGADAVRHCVWNGLMKANLDWDTARGFGDRHEEDGAQRADQREMDLHNNHMGMKWGDSNVEAMVKRCVQGVENGELMRLVN